MNRGLGFLLAVWAIVGALITVAVMFYGGLFLAINPTPWNFPGDPPLFDLLIYAAGIATMVNLPVAVIVGRLGQRSGLVLSIPRLCSAVAVVMLIRMALPPFAATANGARIRPVPTGRGNERKIIKHRSLLSGN